MHATTLKKKALVHKASLMEVKNLLCVSFDSLTIRRLLIFRIHTKKLLIALSDTTQAPVKDKMLLHITRGFNPHG